MKEFENHTHKQMKVLLRIYVNLCQTSNFLYRYVYLWEQNFYRLLTKFIIFETIRDV